ncbi:MAG: DUF4465 domain-containing protein [Paludibacteraceae bacterium]|nr:DUF4465 domain-containing protein [Paludibacteraceae bacterium]
MKKTLICFLICCVSVVYADVVTMDLATATDINANLVTYSSTPTIGAYYDLTDVWEQTYNDHDSCRFIVTNGGVFRLSHLPSAMAYGGLSWEGFTISTVSQDTANVFGCVANGGIGGVGTPYVIGYYSEWVSEEQGYSTNVVQFNKEYYPEYVYICQNSNTYKAITQGEFNARAFTEQDTLALIIQALDSTMCPTATTTFYLAVDGKNNNGWVQVPLSALGRTSCLSFSMTTTDIGAYGANTPLYFALDALTVNTEPITALCNPTISNNNARVILHNSTLYILHHDNVYTLDGRRVIF